MRKTNSYIQAVFLNKRLRQDQDTEEFIQALIYEYEQAWGNLESTIQEIYLTLQDENGNVDTEKLRDLMIAEPSGGSVVVTKLEALQLSIVEEVKGLLAKQDLLTSPFLEGVAQKQYLNYSYEYANLKGTLNNVFEVDSLRIKELTQRKWFGGNYYSRAPHNNVLLANKLDDMLLYYAPMGFPLERMIEDMKDEFNSLGIQRVKTLIQSEVGFLMEQVHYQAMIDAGCTQYQYLATLEISTCDECGELDSKIFNLEDAEVGKNYPLMHGNCRCTVVGILDGVDYNYSKRWMRDPVTGKGKLINAISYQDWLEQYVSVV